MGELFAVVKVVVQVEGVVSKADVELHNICFGQKPLISKLCVIVLSS